MPLLPVAVYGLTVPNGDVLVPAAADFPATFRITMAAIDPTEPAELEEGVTRPRATLKILREEMEEDEDDDDEELLRALQGDSDTEEDESESDEETNGGPSDPSKSKKARKEAAVKQLLEALKADESDEEMEDAETNGVSSDKKKGKAKATEEDSEEDSDEESEDDEDVDLEELVLCTLDPENHYQQPLDITIGEKERVYFKVTGSYTVFLTGNYVIPDDDGHNHHHEVYDSDEDEDYDLSPDEDELELDSEDEESDDLDDLEDPRITEVDSDDEAPKLVAATEKKGKNKRTADEIDASTSLDDLIAKSSKTDVDETKLSKKQQKKLKKNNGEAAAVEAKKEDSTPVKSDKKVQFAKNLEQGPTGSAEKAKTKAEVPKADSGKPTLGVKTVNGVKIDDKKLGSGPACKKGSRVSMRYIGKLNDGKVFDSNKSGKPFTFKLGSGEVIKGWDIGITGMAVGGERRIIIPAHLAYGSKSQPGIPANSTLTFDVKLLEIK